MGFQASSVLIYLMALVALASAASLTTERSYNSTAVTSNCVRQSLCYHSLDCCFGCCIESQCVEDAATPCPDAEVARNCSTMECGGADEECVQEPRFCLLPPPEGPCPQPLPHCRPRRLKPHDAEGRKGVRPTLPPLPVQYPD
ncbi:uncharacterized protein LOC124153207 [Ischnura elegans]|uniref:uncharacterized protein LOC124153207 n=1 Tax=Ischnura elegans TaxID=197161 RepID=UPI001ED8A6E9|nr:uncharacterized protein LOC124153207 [Ischnura elegans]